MSKKSAERFARYFGLIVALLTSATAAHAQAQQPDAWSTTVGVNIMSTVLGSGRGYQAEVRRQAFAVENAFAVDLALFGAVGSTRLSSPFVCELVRVPYCLGGTQSIQTAGFGLSLRQASMRIDGFDVTPRVLAGAAVSHIMQEEAQGPTGLCVIGNELVSCPDNPPFATMTRGTTEMLPLLGYGMSVAHSYDKVIVALDLTAYGTGWKLRNQQTIGIGVQLQLVR